MFDTEGVLFKDVGVDGGDEARCRSEIGEGRRGGELPELELKHEWQQWHGGKVRQTAPHCCHQQAWLWEVLFVLDVASRLFIWEGTAELRNEKV